MTAGSQFKNMRRLFLKTFFIDRRYLVYATKSRFYLDQIADDTQGSTRARTSVSKLRKTAILFPEKDEQIAIADILSEMDMEIAALEGKLAKYRQVKQGMPKFLARNTERQSHIF